MYALREAVGEEAVNRALSKFVPDHRYSCTIAQELVRYLRAQHQQLITDLVERVAPPSALRTIVQAL